MMNEREFDETSDRTPREVVRAADIGIDLELTKRGALNLERDASQHRRFSWLYDDLMS